MKTIENMIGSTTTSLLQDCYYNTEEGNRFQQIIPWVASEQDLDRGEDLLGIDQAMFVLQRGKPRYTKKKSFI